ncbi:hypothetical protein AVEN_232325-1 [Araneus ventricosus]|uniref:Uncharacterized protein n=1 Tax=Araneus ventricosus TaxID=182803 RepID=A0A4Y2HJH7_ARAVE|nr:hypothetical protein AVEN_232325-1 [Araneus ventricosus]
MAAAPYYLVRSISSVLEAFSYYSIHCKAASTAFTRSFRVILTRSISAVLEALSYYSIHCKIVSTAFTRSFRVILKSLFSSGCSAISAQSSLKNWTVVWSCTSHSSSALIHP